MKSLFELLFSFGNPMNFLKKPSWTETGRNRKIPSIVGKIFIVFGFVFLVPGISQSKPQSKIKIDREMVKAVNAGISSIDNMELALKYFFKKPEDRRQIDRDLAQLATLIHKVKWYAESDGHDGLLVKSKKKVLFKFRLLSKGKEIGDFVFGINGYKFTIDPSRSYAHHTKRMEKILGLSRTGLLETLVIKEAYAGFLFSNVTPAAAAGGATSVAATTAWYAKGKEDCREGFDPRKETVTYGSGRDAYTVRETRCIKVDEAKKKKVKGCQTGHVQKIEYDPINTSNGQSDFEYRVKKGCIKKEDCEGQIVKREIPQTGPDGNLVRTVIIEECVKNPQNNAGDASSNDRCSLDEKKEFYNKCRKKQHKDTYDSQDSLNLNYTHFKTSVNTKTNDAIEEACENVDSHILNEKEKERCVNTIKETHKLEIEGICKAAGKTTSSKEKEKCVGFFRNNWGQCLEEKKNRFPNHFKKMCSRPDYVMLNRHSDLKFLGYRLDKLIEKSVKTTTVNKGASLLESEFEMDKCKGFAMKKDTFDVNKGGWGMTDAAADQYCTRAKSLHNLCDLTSKKCSSEVREEEYRDLEEVGEAVQ